MMRHESFVGRLSLWGVCVRYGLILPFLASALVCGCSSSRVYRFIYSDGMPVSSPVIRIYGKGKWFLDMDYEVSVLTPEDGYLEMRKGAAIFVLDKCIVEGHLYSERISDKGFPAAVFFKNKESRLNRFEVYNENGCWFFRYDSSRGVLMIGDVDAAIALMREMELPNLTIRDH